MATEAQNSVIQRKAMGARDEFDARVMSPAKSLRLAVAKKAASMLGMAVTVTMVQQLKLFNKDIQEEAGKDALLLLLDGAAGRRGAAKIDQQFLTALIEMQTMGAVRRAEADTRPVTRTDAAIVAPLLNAVLERYDDQLAEARPEFEKENYRFGDMIEDARALSLALEAPEFDLYRLTLDIDDGAKTGLLTLMLPHREIARAVEKTGKQKNGGSANLEKNALEAQVAIDAVLARLKMPLNKVCKLAPDMVLPLDAACLKETQLVAGDGQVIARVRLGQMNGMRAVMCVAPVTAGQEDAPGEAGAAASGREPTEPPSMPVMPDDVLEGEAHLVPDPSGGDKAPPAKAETPAPEGAPDSAAADTGAEDPDELSPADLLLAAKALTASVREEA